MKSVKLLLVFITILCISCKQDKVSNNSGESVDSILVDEDTSFKLRNISGQTAQDIIFSRTIKLLDVRTYEELLENPRIPGARNFDFNRSDFKEKLGLLEKNQAYLVYCASGIRSAKACRIMHDMGFLSVYNLEGGYEQYKSEGFLDY